MTSEELAAIKARAEAAEPGPWRHDVEDWRVVNNDVRPCTSEEDMTFIAHARMDVPALIAEVERLRALLMPSRPDLSGLSREELAAHSVYVRDVQPMTNEELGIIATVKDDEVK